MIAFFRQWGELIQQLTLREIKARYKQSVLGYAWVLLVPLLRLTVMSVVFSYFFRVDTGHVPYPLFLFAALVPWTFLASAVTAATGSLIANASLITKIKMPRIIFPLAAVMVKMVDLGLSALVLMGMIFLLGQQAYFTWLWIPVILGVQLMLVLGMSFLLAAANVFWRDVENLMEVFLMMWMYLSPVIYPPEFVPEGWRALMNLNPMFGIINAYRNTLLFGVNPPWLSFSYAVGVSLFVFVIGYSYFKRKEKYFADVI